jgi:hypothetical protein
MRYSLFTLATAGPLLVMKALLASTLILGSLLGGLAAHAQTIGSGNKELETKVAAVLQDCANKAAKGLIKSEGAYVKCSNARISQLTAAYPFRDSDLLAIVLAKRLEVAERVDNGLITSAQGELENATARQQTNDISMARDRAAGAPTTTAADALLARKRAVLDYIIRDVFAPVPNRLTFCDRTGNTTTCY